MDMPALQQLPSTYFLDLRLMDDHGKMIENNFYWLSTKPDIPDFENTTWYWTPNKQHADFSALNSMPRTEIKYNYSINEGSDEVSFEVEVDNSTDKIAFFIEFMLVDEKTGEPVLPVFWSDNYISLLPGEQRVLTGTADTSRLKDTKELKIVMQGLNF
ncbi:Exo-beta-D-glucosaminidase [bioreactor metagenome]|uniref:Exo-beta-D-glucosaminidase n=2 Tax=root TaxID=1 RepID=A0A645HB15_9ZZZZ